LEGDTDAGAKSLRHHGAEFETPPRSCTRPKKCATRLPPWDVFTPFPIHGMDRAMGIKNSKVGWFSFIGGCTGYTTGMLMIWFMNAYDYPHRHRRQADVQPVRGLSAVVRIDHSVRLLRRAAGHACS
jgi:hypothetical protein